MKKKLIVMGMAAALVVCGVIGGSLASTVANTEKSAVANINLKALGIVLGDGTATPDTVTEIVNGGLPGQFIGLADKEVTNHTDKGSEYTLYTRVTIDKQWEDDSMSKDAASYIELLILDKADTTESDAGTYKNLEKSQGRTINGWYIHSVDEEQIVMYYTSPLAPDTKTTNFLDGIKLSGRMNNDFSGKKVKLEYTADAVQFDVAVSAMPAEWGVYPVWAKDRDGKDTTTIEKIEE